jgi:hypothetical protein
VVQEWRPKVKKRGVHLKIPQLNLRLREALSAGLFPNRGFRLWIATAWGAIAAFYGIGGLHLRDGGVAAATDSESIVMLQLTPRRPVIANSARIIVENLVADEIRSEALRVRIVIWRDVTEFVQV